MEKTRVRPLHQVPNGPSGIRWLGAMLIVTGLGFYLFHAAQSPARDLKESIDLKGHSRAVQCVAVTKDGKWLASGGLEGALILWDLKKREHRVLQRTKPDDVRSVAFTSDGKMLASGSGPFDNTVTLWNVMDGSTICNLKGHTLGVGSLAFSPDGKILASGSYKEIRIWDVARHKEIATVQGHTDHVTCLAFSPDGKTLASGGWDNKVKLWELSSRRERATLEEQPGWVHSLAFTPNGKILAVACGTNYEQRRPIPGEIILWDVDSRKKRGVLKGHKGAVHSIAIANDTDVLASGSADRTVRVWDISTAEELHTFTGHHEWVQSVAITRDGRTIVSAGGDCATCPGPAGELKIWNVPVPTKR